MAESEMMRRTIAFSASVLLGITITACQPTPECDQACADNVNAAIVRQVEADRAALQLDPFLTCYSSPSTAHHR